MVFRWLQFWRRKEEAEVHDHLAEELLKSVIRLERTIDKALNLLIHVIENRESRITGGHFRQIGHPMLPIQPGNSPQFQITPEFSGPPFTPLAASASVVSSDPTNFPIALDATGLVVTAAIPASAVIPGGSEAITVTWTYINLDGSIATVVGTVTETGIVVSNIVGGSFAQIV